VSVSTEAAVNFDRIAGRVVFNMDVLTFSCRFTKAAVAIREEASIRLQAFTGGNAGPAGVGGNDPSFVADLKGVRVGLIRNFPCLDGQQSAVFEAFVDRLKKRAGIEVISLNFDWHASSTSTAAAAALGGADGGVTAGLDKVIDPILGYELPRELSLYLSTHTALPPKPAPVFDDDGNEIPPAEPDPDDAEAVAAAAKAKIPRSMDSLVTLRNVLEAFSGTPADKAFLMAQLENYSSSTGSYAGVGGRLYQAALVRKRVELQHYLMNDLFKQHKLDVLLYPATPLPPSPLKSTEDTLPAASGSSSSGDSSPKAADSSIVVGNGSVYYRYSRLASASGFPALALPIGMTKPLMNAVRGMPGSERLPVAVEAMAPHGNDVRLLAIARAFQGLQSLLPDPVVVAHWNEGVSVGVAK
jgi:Asp-tRNA(Asn)/Glu-tRNA(Gln) amidotransferase A subunit family amidase